MYSGATGTLAQKARRGGADLLWARFCSHSNPEERRHANINYRIVSRCCVRDQSALLVKFAPRRWPCDAPCWDRQVRHMTHWLLSMFCGWWQRALPDGRKSDLKSNSADRAGREAARSGLADVCEILD
jgi:hypothetical protein